MRERKVGFPFKRRGVTLPLISVYSRNIRHRHRSCPVVPLALIRAAFVVFQSLEMGPYFNKVVIFGFGHFVMTVMGDGIELVPRDLCGTDFQITLQMSFRMRIKGQSMSRIISKGTFSFHRLYNVQRVPPQFVVLFIARQRGR